MIVIITRNNAWNAKNPQTNTSQTFWMQAGFSRLATTSPSLRDKYTQERPCKVEQPWIHPVIRVCHLQVAGRASSSLGLRNKCEMIA